MKNISNVLLDTIIEKINKKHSKNIFLNKKTYESKRVKLKSYNQMFKNVFLPFNQYCFLL